MLFLSLNISCDTPLKSHSWTSRHQWLRGQPLGWAQVRLFGNHSDYGGNQSLHILFFFSIYILNFLYFSYLISFLFPIHFYSSSDPPYPEPTPHSTPHLGLAKAGPTIPKSGNWWHCELKTRRSQDWMQQFRVCLGWTKSHERGEDVGSDGEDRRRGYGMVFPFPSFLISFQYYFSIFSMVFHLFTSCLFRCIQVVILSLSTMYIQLGCWLMWLPVIRATLTELWITSSPPPFCLSLSVIPCGSKSVLSSSVLPPCPAL